MQGRGEKRGREHALQQKPLLCTRIALASSGIALAFPSLPPHAQTSLLGAHPGHGQGPQEPVLSRDLALGGGQWKPCGESPGPAGWPAPTRARSRAEGGRVPGQQGPQGCRNHPKAQSLPEGSAPAPGSCQAPPCSRGYRCIAGRSRRGAAGGRCRGCGSVQAPGRAPPAPEPGPGAQRAPPLPGGTGRAAPAALLRRPRRPVSLPPAAAGAGVPALGPGSGGRTLPGALPSGAVPALRSAGRGSRGAGAAPRPAGSPGRCRGNVGEPRLRVRRSGESAAAQRSTRTFQPRDWILFLKSA